MPGQSSDSFAPVLKVVLEFAGLGPAGFENDFLKFCAKNRLSAATQATVRGWLAEKSHRPHNDYRAHLADYFREKLPWSQFKDDFFDLNADSLRAHLDKLKSENSKNLPPPLPFTPDNFQSREFINLCGTYILYRHALVKGRLMISCDVVRVQKENTDNALAITMYCVPAKGATDERPASLDEQELFTGRLWKFNNLYFAMTMFNDPEETSVRRVHTLQFPVLATQPVTHYGIMGGYGAILAKPFSARVILRKVSGEDVSDEMRKKWVQPFKENHTNVSTIAVLLKNIVDEGQSVLTIDSTKLQTIDFPPIETAKFSSK